VRIGPACVPAMSQLIKGDNIELKSRAAAVLQGLGAGAKESTVTLLKELDSSDRERVQMAAVTLLKISEKNQKALTKLVEMLSNPDDRTRQSAATALGKVGVNARRAVPTLIRALKDKNPLVRMQSAQALGEIGPPASAAVTALIEAATAKHPYLVTSFEGIGYDGSIHSASIIALGKIGSPAASAAVPMLIQTLEKHDNVSAVLDALAKLKSAAAPAVPILASNLADTRQLSPRDVIAVLVAIGNQAQPAIPAIEKLVVEGPSPYRKDAFLAILSIESDQNKRRAEVMRHLGSTDFSLQQAATEAASTMNLGADSVQLLIEGLASRQHTIKVSCAKALGNIGPAATAALPVLLENNLRSGSYMRDERSSAFEAIKKIDPSGQKVIPLLGPALDDRRSVHNAVKLLEFIASPQTNELAQSTKIRWNLK